MGWPADPVLCRPAIGHRSAWAHRTAPPCHRLFVLAPSGNADKDRLGDHSPAGYAQRARFYGGVSDEARRRFARGVARYIIFLARTTGFVDDQRADGAELRLRSLESYGDLLRDIDRAPASGL